MPPRGRGCAATTRANICLKKTTRTTAPAMTIPFFKSHPHGFMALVHEACARLCPFQVVAIKKMTNSLKRSQTARQIAREAVLLRQLRHVNLIRLHEILPGARLPIVPYRASSIPLVYWISQWQRKDACWKGVICVIPLGHVSGVCVMGTLLCLYCAGAGCWDAAMVLYVSLFRCISVSRSVCHVACHVVC